MKMFTLIAFVLLSLAAQSAVAQDLSIGIGGVYVGYHGRGHYHRTEVYVDTTPVYVERREVIYDSTPVYHDGGYYVDYVQGGHRYTGSYPDNYHTRGGWREHGRDFYDRDRWQERRERDSRWRGGRYSH